MGNCASKTTVEEIGAGREESHSPVTDPEMQVKLSVKVKPIASSLLATPAIVVGISGASRSGKTSLAKQLASELESATVLSQDDFADGRLAAQHPSGFEASESIAHDDLRSALAEVLESGRFRYVIVEGFRAFADPLLVQSFDVLIWLDVSRDVCHARRMATTAVSEAFFTQHLWARHVEYEEHWNARLASDAEMRRRLQVIDGEEPMQDVLREALCAVHASKDSVETVAWPMTKLLRATAAVAADERLAVVLMTGAMNPPHLGHLQMLHQASARLRMLGYTVVGAWLSPSHDGDSPNPNHITLT